MTERAARRLDSKPLLVTAGLVAVALPVAFGWLEPTQAGAATRAQNTAAVGQCTTSRRSNQTNLTTGCSG